MSESEGELSDITGNANNVSLGIGFDLSDIDLRDSETSDDSDNTPIESDDSDDDGPQDFTNQLKPIAIRPFSGPIGITHGLGDDAIELDYFKLLFTDDMLNDMSLQTNLYAQQCIAEKPDPQWTDTTMPEMRAFLAIQILMGIDVLPEQRMYWSSNEYLGELSSCTLQTLCLE